MRCVEKQIAAVVHKRNSLKRFTEIVPKMIEASVYRYAVVNDAENNGMTAQTVGTTRSGVLFIGITISRPGLFKLFAFIYTVQARTREFQFFFILKAFVNEKFKTLINIYIYINVNI